MGLADDLYDKILELSLRYRCYVITGTDRHDTLPLTFFEYLGSDLREIDALVLADIHGDQLKAFLTRGALSMPLLDVRVLKVSDQDPVADGASVDVHAHVHIPEPSAETRVSRRHRCG